MGVRQRAGPGHPDKLHYTVLYSGAPPPRPQDWGSQDVRIQSAIRHLTYHIGLGLARGLAGRWVWREMVLREGWGRRFRDQII